MPEKSASPKRRPVEPEKLVEALHSRRGLAIVVSAPSGTGKTTVSSEVLAHMPDVFHSVSVTTRPPRKQERHGKEYFFVSHEEFREQLKSGLLVEWAEVHGYLYGTPRKYLEERIQAGKDTVLDIDVQGGASLRKMFREALLIFLMPPSMAELERRLRSRSSDSDRDIAVRLQNALKEIEQHHIYDYLVVNDDVKKAARVIQSIIVAERHRMSRLLTK